MDCRQDVLGVGILQQIAVQPTGQALDHGGFVGVHRQDQHAQRWPAALELDAEGDTVTVGQLQVEQRDRGLDITGQLAGTGG